ncbi:hypothetical protein BB558_006357 [Smittium angustum]|uniref:Uncharacterized protein n=1 Tax=Smittium angustum TaxID=133377 RepID=A0A2U1IY26_SMIAN|nr:hypothetical protein BB558_006357 [Smittium angustum]
MDSENHINKKTIQSGYFDEPIVENEFGSSYKIMMDKLQRPLVVEKIEQASKILFEKQSKSSISKNDSYIDVSDFVPKSIIKSKMDTPTTLSSIIQKPEDAKSSNNESTTIIFERCINREDVLGSIIKNRVSPKKALSIIRISGLSHVISRWATGTGWMNNGKTKDKNVTLMPFSELKRYTDSYSEQWTKCVTDFLDSVVDEASRVMSGKYDTDIKEKQIHSSLWEKKWSYTQNLLWEMYKEELVDQRYLIKWILDKFGKASEGISIILLKVIFFYKGQISKARSPLRQLVSLLIKKISALIPLNILLGYKTDLLALLTELLLEFPDVLVEPTLWRKQQLEVEHLLNHYKIDLIHHALYQRISDSINKSNMRNQLISRFNDKIADLNISREAFISENIFYKKNINIGINFVKKCFLNHLSKKQQPPGKTCDYPFSEENNQKAVLNLLYWSVLQDKTEINTHDQHRRAWVASLILSDWCNGNLNENYQNPNTPTKTNSFPFANKSIIESQYKHKPLESSDSNTSTSLNLLTNSTLLGRKSIIQNSFMMLLTLQKRDCLNYYISEQSIEILAESLMVNKLFDGRKFIHRLIACGDLEADNQNPRSKLLQKYLMRLPLAARYDDSSFDLIDLNEKLEFLNKVVLYNNQMGYKSSVISDQNSELKLILKNRLDIEALISGHLPFLASYINLHPENDFPKPPQSYTSIPLLSKTARNIYSNENWIAPLSDEAQDALFLGLDLSDNLKNMLSFQIPRSVVYWFLSTKLYSVVTEKFIVQSVKVGAENWRVITKGGTSLLNRRQLSTLVRIYEVGKCYNKIIDMLLWLIDDKCANEFVESLALGCLLRFFDNIVLENRVIEVLELLVKVSSKGPVTASSRKFNYNALNTLRRFCKLCKANKISLPLQQEPVNYIERTYLEWLSLIQQKLNLSKAFDYSEGTKDQLVVEAILTESLIMVAQRIYENVGIGISSINLNIKRNDRSIENRFEQSVIELCQGISKLHGGDGMLHHLSKSSHMQTFYPINDVINYNQNQYICVSGIDLQGSEFQNILRNNIRDLLQLNESVDTTELADARAYWVSFFIVGGGFMSPTNLIDIIYEFLCENVVNPWQLLQIIQILSMLIPQSDSVGDVNPKKIVKYGNYSRSTILSEQLQIEFPWRIIDKDILIEISRKIEIILTITTILCQSLYEKGNNNTLFSNKSGTTKNRKSVFSNIQTIQSRTSELFTRLGSNKFSISQNVTSGIVQILDPQIKSQKLYQGYIETCCGFGEFCSLELFIALCSSQKIHDRAKQRLLTNYLCNNQPPISTFDILTDDPWIIQMESSIRQFSCSTLQEIWHRSRAAVQYWVFFLFGKSFSDGTKSKRDIALKCATCINGIFEYVCVAFSDHKVAEDDIELGDFALLPSHNSSETMESEVDSDFNVYMLGIDEKTICQYILKNCNDFFSTKNPSASTTTGQLRNELDDLNYKKNISASVRSDSLACKIAVIVFGELLNRFITLSLLYLQESTSVQQVNNISNPREYLDACYKKYMSNSMILFENSAIWIGELHSSIRARILFLAYVRLFGLENKNQVSQAKSTSSTSQPENLSPSPKDPLESLNLYKSAYLINENAEPTHRFDANRKNVFKALSIGLLYVMEACVKHDSFFIDHSKNTNNEQNSDFESRKRVHNDAISKIFGVLEINSISLTHDRTFASSGGLKNSCDSILNRSSFPYTQNVIDEGKMHNLGIKILEDLLSTSQTLSRSWNNHVYNILSLGSYSDLPGNPVYGVFETPTEINPNELDLSKSSTELTFSNTNDDKNLTGVEVFVLLRVLVIFSSIVKAAPQGTKADMWLLNVLALATSRGNLELDEDLIDLFYHYILKHGYEQNYNDIYSSITNPIFDSSKKQKLFVILEYYIDVVTVLSDAQSHSNRKFAFPLLRKINPKHLPIFSNKVFLETEQYNKLFGEITRILPFKSTNVTFDNFISNNGSKEVSIDPSEFTNPWLWIDSFGAYSQSNSNTELWMLPLSKFNAKRRRVDVQQRLYES